MCVCFRRDASYSYRLFIFDVDRGRKRNGEERGMATSMSMLCSIDEGAGSVQTHNFFFLDVPRIMIVCLCMWTQRSRRSSRSSVTRGRLDERNNFFHTLSLYLVLWQRKVDLSRYMHLQLIPCDLFAVLARVGGLPLTREQRRPQLSASRTRHLVLARLSYVWRCESLGITT